MTSGLNLWLAATRETLFNRASINISQVHYDDSPAKALGSATAISTIIHPCSPHAPSLHMHISWTEMRSGEGYWRIMADLNPSLPCTEDTAFFVGQLRHATSSEIYAEAARQGDMYFYIPALKRHRGVTHFYLEQFRTDRPADDRALAENFGKSAVEAYTTILRARMAENRSILAEHSKAQVNYHTVYAFQVLTLDRGTTSGLLVHEDNDLGILGSLPARVDRDLLSSWAPLCPAPVDKLVPALVRCLPASGEVDDGTKRKLANEVRSFFRKHPQALDLQARAEKIPPTVANHLGPGRR